MKVSVALKAAGASGGCILSSVALVWLARYLYLSIQVKPTTNAEAATFAALGLVDFVLVILAAVALISALPAAMVVVIEEAP